MKFDKIKPGMILYDRHKSKTGNTTMKTLGEWMVEIISVDEGGAFIKWNGNPPQRSWPRNLEKFKTWSMNDECAEKVVGLFGRVFSVKLKKGFKAPPAKFTKVAIRPEDL